MTKKETIAQAAKRLEEFERMFSELAMSEGEETQKIVAVLIDCASMLADNARLDANALWGLITS